MQYINKWQLLIINKTREGNRTGLYINLGSDRPQIDDSTYETAGQ